MDETKEKKDAGKDIFETGHYTVPRRTGFFTGPPPVGKLIREAKDSERVEYYKESKQTVRSVLWYRSIDGEWFSQESTELGEGDKQRFMDQFGTPIGSSKKKG